MKRSLPVVLLLVLAALAVVAQTTPRLLPFQGRLTDPQGTSVSDGAKVVQFQLYGALTGGSALWGGEVHRTTVNGGLANVLLGGKSSFPTERADHPGESFWDQVPYLQITVDGNGDNAITAADPPLLPRQEVFPAIFSTESASSRLLGGYGCNVLFGATSPADGTLLDFKIRDASIGSSKLAPSAVTSARVQNGAITPEKLAAQIVEALVPLGTIVSFAGTAAPSSGWFIFDGCSVSRSQYARLFDIIGVVWRSRDGVTTFNLPDLRGMFLRGANLGRSDGYGDPEAAIRTNAVPVGKPETGNSGDNVGIDQLDAFQGHCHRFQAPGIGIICATSGRDWMHWDTQQALRTKEMFAKNPITDGIYGEPRTSLES